MRTMSHETWLTLTLHAQRICRHVVAGQAETVIGEGFSDPRSAVREEYRTEQLVALDERHAAALAFGLMRHHIRVNQVNPGWMDTESEHRVQVEQDGASKDWLAAAEAARPMGRLVKPWGVANAIELCLSPDSGMMTGNCIDMDQPVRGAGDPPIPTVDDTVAP